MFALLAHQDKATLNPLNLDQWRFWAVPTARLNELPPTARTLSLAALQGIAGALVGFRDLKALVDALPVPRTH